MEDVDLRHAEEHLEELIGHSILRLFDAHDHQTVLEQLSICASNPTKLFHWEIQKIRKSGVRIWVREHALAIQDETGTTVILVVCEDITAHKQVELRLQKINACFGTARRRGPKLSTAERTL